MHTPRSVSGRVLARISVALLAALAVTALSACGGSKKTEKLTVSDVAARIQADEAVKGSVKQELNTVVQQLRQSTMPLPANLGLHSIRALFAQLGLRVSKQLQKVFSETALFLTSGREQGMAHLAATRRQREHSRLREKQQREQEEEQS